MFRKIKNMTLVEWMILVVIAGMLATAFTTWMDKHGITIRWHF